MNDEEAEEISKFFQPLKQELGDILKSIIITGSAVRKERVEGSDIDILVIIDDHKEKYNKKDKKKADKIISKIGEKAEKEGYDLHIQPSKTLSSWYSLLIKGKPWAVTSMIHSQPLYDPDNFQETTEKMISNSEPKSRERRVQKLENEVEEHIEKADNKLEDGFEATSKNLTRVANTLLRLRTGEKIPEKQFFDEIKNNSLLEEIDKEKLIGLKEREQRIVEREEDKSFEKLGEFSNQSAELIEQIQEHFQDGVEELWGEIMNQTIEEIEQNCKILLENQDIEYDSNNVFKKFQEEIIEKEMITEEYEELINKTISLKEKESKIKEEEIHNQIAGLRELETATNNIIEEDIFQEFELKSNSEEARITPINEYEERLLNKHKSSIKGIYVITAENLLETESATTVVIVDEDQQIDTGKVSETAAEIEEEIGKEHGFNIQTNTEKLTKYWSELQDGNKELIYELKSGIISYDPNRLLESTQKLIENGKIPGTIPKIKRKMEKSSIKTLMPVKKVKNQCLEEYYNAAIKKGQAELLKQGITPPVQKKVPKLLKKETNKTSLKKTQIATLEEIIKKYKLTEYDRTELKESEIDKYRKKLKSIEN